MKSYFFSIILSLFFFLPSPGQEDELVLDQVIAVVGGKPILASDVEGQYQQYRMQGNLGSSADNIRCRILESLLFEKLLLNQAELDSVEITDTQVEANMDQKLRYFISQLGSKENLEEYYGKTILEIKDEFSEIIRDQMKVEQVKQTIAQNIRVTPSEVRKFFKQIPEDSIPTVNAELEIGQIVKIPPITLEERQQIKEKLQGLKERIGKGESFSTLAILYSEDEKSAKKGGEMGFKERSELIDEIEAVAFKLGKCELSKVIESEKGFHLIQLIERRGETVNLRMILLKPKVSPLELQKAKNQLDSVAYLLESGKLTFEEAVEKYSDDPGAKSGGLLVNAMTGTSKFSPDQLDPSVAFVVQEIEEGEVSSPVPMKTEEGMDAYRILYLKNRVEPHRANLEEDYDKIQQWALEEKRAQAILKWIKNKTAKTHVKVDDNFHDCPFDYPWINTEESN